MSDFGTASEKKDLTYWIHTIIVICLMFGFQFLPPFGPVTALGMQTLGIFLGLLWAWTFVDFIWPSLLGIIAVGLSGYMTMDAAFKTAFGDQTVLLVFFVFALAAYLTATGLCRTIAYWFISRKACIGRPYVFFSLLMLACYVIGGTVGTMGAIVIGWAVVYEICEIIGFEKGDKFPIAALIGVVLTSMLGATVFPFRALAALVLNQVHSITGLTVGFGAFFISAFVASILATVLYILTVKFIFKPDMKGLTAPDDIYAKFRAVKMDRSQKVGVIGLIVVIVGACAPSFLPASWAITAFFAKFSLGPLIALVMLILAAIQIKEQKICDIGQSIKNGVDWSTIIMLAGSMPVAAMMKDPEAGVTVLINQALTGFLGDASPFLIAVIFIVFAGIVTQVAHNLVMGIVLAPILANLSLAMGFDPLPIAIFLSFVCNLGIATPGASVMGAMLFANRSWIPVKDCFKYTWVCVFEVILCIICFGLPIAHFFC